MKDIDDFETNPAEYTAKIHRWFCHEDAEKIRVDTNIFLQSLINIEMHKVKYQ